MLTTPPRQPRRQTRQLVDSILKGFQSQVDGHFWSFGVYIGYRFSWRNMKTRVTLVSIYLAIYFPAAALRSGLDSQWSSRQSSDEEKSLERRYWNDDLEPCIIKYCLKFRHVMRNYMHCIQKYCPSGLVTVPRDIPKEVELMDSMDNKPATFDVESQRVHGLCSLLCHNVKSPLLQKACALSRCHARNDPQERDPDELEDPSPWTAPVMWGNGIDSLVESNGVEDRTERQELLGKVKGNELCGLVLCLTLHGAEFLDCVQERCRGQEPEEAPTDIAGAVVEDSYTATDESDRTLKRKRRINDDVSQCIQSYCGSIASEVGRLACIVRSCHRAG